MIDIDVCIPSIDTRQNSDGRTPGAFGSPTGGLHYTTQATTYEHGAALCKLLANFLGAFCFLQSAFSPANDGNVSWMLLNHNTLLT
jgi:hypothetical protein